MALTTTSASMVAVINAIVAGCGLAMAAVRMGGIEPRNGLMLGAVAAFVLMAAFVAYEHWRFNGAADSGRRPSGEQSVLIAPYTSLLRRRGGGTFHDRVFLDESRIDLDP